MRKEINIISKVTDKRFWVYDECLDKLRFRINPEVRNILEDEGMKWYTILELYKNIEAYIDMGMERIEKRPDVRSDDDYIFIMPTGDEFINYDERSYWLVYDYKRYLGFNTHTGCPSIFCFWLARLFHNLRIIRKKSLIIDL